ncbi:MAG: hypothetical protein KBG15_15210 [Kofleriaceae bacterium]|nr:hypothetical protein [Kofleriaceae bacterium]
MRLPFLFCFALGTVSIFNQPAAAQRPSDERFTIIAPPPQPKSVRTAQLLATVGTLVPVATFAISSKFDSDALFAVGALTTFIGPSLGQIYAGAFTGPRSERTTAVVGPIMRATGALSVLVGGTMLGVNAFTCSLAVDDQPCEPSTVANALMYAGGALALVGAIHSIVNTGDAVRHANTRAQQRWSLTPTIAPSSASGATTYGCALGGSF